MSINLSTIGLQVLSHILKLPVQEAGHALVDASPYLTYDEDRAALDYIRKHLSKTGSLPHPETVLAEVAIYLPEPKEPLSYCMEKLRGRWIEEGMKRATEAAQSLILDSNPEEALTAMLGHLMPLTNANPTLSLFDLRDTEDSALSYYLSQLDGTAPPLKGLGFPYLDSQGGIEPGDMIGIIGRPASGKTWLMIAMAIHYWRTYKEPVLFVTQEMGASQIERRMLPFVAGVDPTPLYKGIPSTPDRFKLTDEEYRARLHAAAKELKNEEIPFLIYDSKMAGTVGDVEAISAIHNCNAVFLDGAYMLRHPDPSLGRYARVPENLDLMKKFAQRTGKLLVSSWQFKRSAGKVQEETTPDLDDIGYSHAIAEYMSVILGLMEKPNTGKKIDRKKVTVMKGRNGEIGDFEIHWDFSTMNFTEIEQDESLSGVDFF